MPARTRILALCGARSNSEVVKLQLNNLRISEDAYDIVYLHGVIEVEEEGSELSNMVRGPFYSWLTTENEHRLNASVLDSVRLVLEAIEVRGPFDGIFGFSNGGLIATLVAGIADDPILQDNIKQHMAGKRQWGMALGLMNNGTPISTERADEIFNSIDVDRSGHIDVNELQTSLHSMGMQVSSRDLNTMVSVIDENRDGVVDRSEFRRFTRMASVQFRNTVQERDHDVGTTIILDPPFKFCILGCVALDQSSALHSITCSSRKFILGKEGRLIGVKSIHLIGIEDEMKSQSENVASLFKGGSVLYMSGGHQVGRELRNDEFLCSSLKQFIKSNGHPQQVQMLSEFKPMSEVSSVALHPTNQVALVQLKDALLPATIIDSLEAQPRANPFLYNARNPQRQATTYGQALDFIRGGEGDLRRLGVKEGEVVAYGVPPGGSAVAALAFLSIGAQTTAAPLAPTTTEPDALDALDQFHAKHLILFEGVDCPGVEAAFKKYSDRGEGIIHTARIIGSKPGQFEFTSIQVSNLSSLPELSNPKNGHCLLLRTSGTTARPKGVPLEQGALVSNGAIIAASMQLTAKDTCYSVMPLFHIGGLSASILCTLASGGSVCCDGEPFDASRMVDALAISNPQPTWYSSVPTIHNATVAFLKENTKDNPKFAGYGVKNGIWEKGHSLRMIRSGAAALLAPDAAALSAAYGWVSIYPTYSMSEQMPISQPPAGKGDMITDKPGSVGVPVATSLAIVGRSHYRPQPYGTEGEIAISGPTVMHSYLENPDADAKSFFFLTMPGDGNEERNLGNCRYFLTGDVGVLDRDGFLSLKGRAKELIKKGGEQVSPHEVEEVLCYHPWIKTSLCVSVPSKVYGEEVGCALVLSIEAPIDVDTKTVIKTMRSWLKQRQLAPYKWPTKWTIIEDHELPRTATKKLVRVNTAEKLGFLDVEGESEVEVAKTQTKAVIDWEVITGFRFILACYVMFMHIGSSASWSTLNNLRGWPWHVHCFFTLGGFSMASPMNPKIQKKFSYFKSRIAHMYPLYAMSLLFGMINLLVVCRPSTFRMDFHWDSQPDDLTSGLFCEGTPMLKQSYYGSLILTIVVYIFGLAVTPLWPMGWWMGYYLWFSSMYYQCLAFFPAIYNYLLQASRKRLGFLLMIMSSLQLLNVMILFSAWVLMKRGEGFNHYNSETGEPNDPTDYTDGAPYNIAVLSFYLFGPFWVIYFVIGTVLAFLYDAIKPNEKHNARLWGWVADGCTLLMVCISVVIICQGGGAEEKYFRPAEADEYTDSSTTIRLWDNICGRIMCPITTLWIFALSTGRGYTASILRADFLVNFLGQHSYGCFLFHQMVGQWYYAATRNGTWWNWWRYRKGFYWFSPAPCPVEWYEYFYVVGIVVVFSRFTEHTLMPAAKKGYTRIKDCFRITDQEEEEEVDVRQTLFNIIERMTGIEPEMDSTLDEVGLASVGIPVIVGMLNDAFSRKNEPCDITHQDLMGAKTMGDIIAVVENAKARMHHDGV